MSKLDQILMNGMGVAYAESKGLIKKEKVNKFKAFYESGAASKRLDLMGKNESFRTTINEVINYTRGYSEANMVERVVAVAKDSFLTILEKVMKFMKDFLNIGYEAQINKVLEKLDKLSTQLKNMDQNKKVTLPGFIFITDKQMATDTLNTLGEYLKYYSEATREALLTNDLSHITFTNKPSEKIFGTLKDVSNVVKEEAKLLGENTYSIEEAFDIVVNTAFYFRSLLKYVTHIENINKGIKNLYKKAKKSEKEISKEAKDMIDQSLVILNNARKLYKAYIGDGTKLAIALLKNLKYSDESKTQ